MHLFLDCEFNGWHDHSTGDLISLALVSADATYCFYEVVACSQPLPFVAQHVLPVLGKDAIPLWALANKLSRFLWEINAVESCSLTIVADYPSDIELFNRTLLVGQGQCLSVPAIHFLLDLSLSTQLSAIPHNALEDAKALSQDYANKYSQLDF
ncbi:hypothetical protein [Acinetobacter sp. MD2]|uniref:hypothetical protein n=1 Tax=Acinetobacter sp. MD2 TaxID=2600066 RepID=UPI002D1F5477|nr:hypothetical protein [Acinetobacter sp. MD2]MEB3766503.1 hypothetical protein [Acinetobacter sp. MD2]